MPKLAEGASLFRPTVQNRNDLGHGHDITNASGPEKKKFFAPLFFKKAFTCFKR
jgi:hypothetical protein